jgi:hypothetical protein
MRISLFDLARSRLDLGPQAEWVVEALAEAPRGLAGHGFSRGGSALVDLNRIRVGLKTQWNGVVVHIYLYVVKYTLFRSAQCADS